MASAVSNSAELFLHSPTEYVWQHGPYPPQNRIEYGLALSFRKKAHLIPLRMASEPAPFSYTSGMDYHYDQATLFVANKYFLLQHETIGEGTGIKGEAISSRWYVAKIYVKFRAFTWSELPYDSEYPKWCEKVTRISSDDTKQLLPKQLPKSVGELAGYATAGVLKNLLRKP